MAELMAGLQARVIETLPPSMGYIAELIESLLETSSLMVLTFLGPVLLRLYLHGPGLWNFGFWASVSPLEICNRISTAAPEFWITRADACYDLIFARFHGFFLGWCALGYLGILVLMIPWTVRLVRWTFALLLPWAFGLVPWALGVLPSKLGLLPSPLRGGPEKRIATTEQSETRRSMSPRQFVHERPDDRAPGK